MEVVFREIKTKTEIEQFYFAQEKIFDMRTEDRFPEHFISMISRNDPEMGFVFGAFKKHENKDELIGVNISITSSEQGSLYAIGTGVLPEYRNGIYGPKLISKVREFALLRNYNFYYSIFNHLESNLGRLYFSLYGFVGVRYKIDPYSSGNDSFPNDKVLIKWDLLNSKNRIKEHGTEPKKYFYEALKSLSVADEKNMPNEGKLLVKIPNDYKTLKENNSKQAISICLNLRIVLTEYLNNRGYCITDCITGKIDGTRKSYYILELIRQK